MTFGLIPRLDQHRIFGSSDVDETRAFLHSKNFRLEFASRDAGSFDARINGIYMPGMYLGYIQYGPEVRVRAAARDDYWLQLPLRGQLEVVSHTKGVVCSTQQAGFASPTRSDYYLVKSGAGCGGLRISMYKSALVGCLTSLLGEPPCRPLEFAPDMDVSSGHGLSIARFFLTAVDDFENRGSIQWSRPMKRAFEQFLMTALLNAQPHNYTDRLTRLETRLAPRDVKRAVDFIEANLDLPISVGDIIAAAGVPGRTLFKHFRDFKGVSPLRYLRNARFERVRRELLLADEGASITHIAMEAGFMHLGRFSVEYRQRFGETPSQTLKRRVRPH